MTTYSETLSEFISDISYDDMSPDLVQFLKLSLLDLVGICIHTSRMPVGVAVKAATAPWESENGSALIGFREKLPAPFAALVNGTTGGFLELDDSYIPGVVHPGSVNLPAALAAAEQVHASGKDLLIGMAVGLEIQCRVALVAQAKLHERGFHGTPITGTMGATAAAAKVFGLTSAQTTNAFGVAGSQAAGLWEFLTDGSWTKAMHPGWAAHCGVVSASLGRAGFLGPRTVFEGRFGLFKAHLGEDVDLQGLVNELGTRWEASQIAFKPYPCGNVIHASMDCAIGIKKEQRLSISDIQDVECFISPRLIPIVGEPAEVVYRPPTSYGAKFSLPYCVAIALIEGGATVDSFSDDRFTNPEVLELTRRVRVSPDPESEYPKVWSGWVKLTTTDGRLFEKRMRHHRGSPENPVTFEERIAKYRGLIKGVVDAERGEEIQEAILSIDHVKDLQTLTALLAAG